MRRLSLSIAAVAAAAVLAGCSALGQSATTDDTTTDSTSTTSTVSTSTLTADSILDANEDATTVNDDEWSIADAVDITLSGTSATSSSDAVASADGTVTISAAGVYRLTGSLDGQVVVDAGEDDLVVLVLDGADISSSTSAAISVLSADDVGIYLAEGSTNTLSDTSGYAEDADVNAALFSEEDLTISGTGALTVTGNGNDGITSEDDLVILSGTITVTAVDDGIRGKDSLTIEGGTITVTAGGDGLKADNEDEDTRGYIVLTGGTVTLDAGDDGFDAVTDIVVTGGEATVAVNDVDSEESTSKGVDAGAVFVMEDGTLTVTSSVEAIEAATVVISGGTVDLTASDDGINASTGSGESMQADAGAYLEISGGTTTIDAEGDGVDSNGDALFSGGVTTIYGPTRSGNGALDTNGTLTVSGGTLVAFDAGGMTETPAADSSQGWLAVTTSGNAGDTVQIADADGNTIAEVTSTKAFGAVVYSSSEVASGESYTVTTGSGESTVTANQGGTGGMGGGPGGGRQGGR